MPQAQEAPATQAWEVPTMQAQDGSSTALLQGAPAWVEAVAFNTLLGVDSVEANRTKNPARRGDWGSVLGHGGAQLQAMRS
jgi:hypothetical protein